MVKNFEDIYNRLNRMPSCGAMHTGLAVKTVENIFALFCHNLAYQVV